jgi:hypothetical protein
MLPQWHPPTWSMIVFLVSTAVQTDPNHIYPTDAPPTARFGAGTHDWAHYSSGAAGAVLNVCAPQRRVCFGSESGHSTGSSGRIPAEETLEAPTPALTIDGGDADAAGEPLRVVWSSDRWRGGVGDIDRWRRERAHRSSAAMIPTESFY